MKRIYKGENEMMKLTNKDENFYQYMGKFFGSRLVERQTNDRIYDDDNKEWYVYLEEEEVKAFVSVSKNVIKNVYTTKDEYLEEILGQIQKEMAIADSIVTNCYVEIYEKCGFEVKSQAYKNFVTISSSKKEKIESE